jgi:hypothetical protein
MRRLESAFTLGIFLDPAGDTVLTSVVDNTSNAATITCTGGSAVVVSLDCLSSSADSGTPACPEPARRRTPPLGRTT